MAFPDTFEDWTDVQDGDVISADHTNVLGSLAYRAAEYVIPAATTLPYSPGFRAAAWATTIPFTVNSQPSYYDVSVSMPSTAAAVFGSSVFSPGMMFIAGARLASGGSAPVVCIPKVDGEGNLRVRVRPIRFSGTLSNGNYVLSLVVLGEAAGPLQSSS